MKKILAINILLLVSQIGICQENLLGKYYKSDFLINQSSSIQLMERNRYEMEWTDCTRREYSYGNWELINDSILFKEASWVEVKFKEIDSLQVGLFNQIRVIDKGKLKEILPSEMEVYFINQENQTFLAKVDKIGYYTNWDKLHSIRIKYNAEDYIIDIPNGLKNRQLIVVIYTSNKNLEMKILGEQKITKNDFVVHPNGKFQFDKLVGKFVKNNN